MAPKRKAPTASGISALLGKAGFDKSVSSKSRIKGLRNWSWGYIVQRLDDVTVVVKHQTWSMRGEEDKKRAELAKYREVIEAAGWRVVGPEPGGFPRLIVTAADFDAESGG